jgi:hypothetical protein
MSNDIERKKWKDERTQRKYGMSYASLCSDRKRIIDQLYQLYLMDKEEKANPRKGCR